MCGEEYLVEVFVGAVDRVEASVAQPAQVVLQAGRRGRRPVVFAGVVVTLMMVGGDASGVESGQG